MVTHLYNNEASSMYTILLLQFEVKVFSICDHYDCLRLNAVSFQFGYCAMENKIIPLDTFNTRQNEQEFILIM